MCCDENMGHWPIPLHVPPRTDGGLEHQVEGDGGGKVIACGGRLDTVFNKKCCQLFLSEVVHLKGN